MLAEHLGDVRGRNVVLKPNLVEFEPESSINTHPILVHAAYEAFRAHGRGQRADCRRSRPSPQYAGPGRGRRILQDQSRTSKTASSI